MYSLPLLYFTTLGAGGYEETVILINSSVLAPVAWSWIFKPILKKLGVDYKQIDKTNKMD
jgi:hypothetical protein